MTHVPVLLKEAIEILDPKPGKFIIDGTVGAGGHAAEILKKIEPGGTLLGIDWDDSAIERAKLNVKGQTSKVIFVHENYADLPKILKEKNLLKADGLIIDLGFSTEELEKSGRGFSFLKDEPLDMRYDIGEVESEKGKVKSGERIQTVAEIVNSYSEKELADIFYIYGEERMSRQIAKKIVEERRKERIMTTGRLVEVVKMAVGKGYEKGRINPATRVFQALRIYVNKELENLETILKNLPEIIRPNGRVVIISFHSLEDRIVKNYFKQMEKEGKGEILTKKPVVASKEEIISNPRSRSAKLRAIIIIKS
ncbi:MAG: 16S rRNA (cytosine(1402)-N(4))-methyltransferase RsmH [Patescibacteria group bacterium]